MLHRSEPVCLTGPTADFYPTPEEHFERRLNPQMMQMGADDGHTQAICPSAHTAVRTPAERTCRQAAVPRRIRSTKCASRFTLHAALGICALIVCAIDVQQSFAQGACCTFDSCEPAADDAECGTIGGVFLDGEDCATDPCAEGACCAGLACVMDGAYSCITAGRDFYGAGTDCADDPCEIGVGACCLGAGACEAISEEDCATAGGTFVQTGTICESGVCDAGSCCSPGSCDDLFRFQCDDAGGLLQEGISCEEAGCDVVFDCPLDALYGQGRSGPTGFTAYTSELSADLQRWDNFSGVIGALDEVRFYGLDLEFAGGFVECTETDPTFQITFYENDAGAPGEIVCDYTLLVTRTPTGIDYLGTELNEYSVVLPQGCTLTEGWISILGLGDPDCWFLWMSSPDGDHISLCDNCQDPIEQSDLSFCLLGDAGGVVGACCDESTGDCADDVDIAACAEPGQGFAPDSACTDLDPPCHVVTGACCYVDAPCEILLETECADSGGSFMGDGSTCDVCPPVGACCFDFENCAPLTEAGCADGGFTWLGGDTTCDMCPLPPMCPADSLFGQEPQGPDDFLAGTSEVSADILRFENFDNVGGAIDSLTFWGVDLEFVGTGFVECVETDNTFEIKFYEDANGGLGAEVCSYTLPVTRTPLGILYIGAELNEYTVTLPEPCVLTHGWVSIAGLGDPSCWFLWMSSDFFGYSLCDGCNPFQQQEDYSFCLQGDTGGVAGACCDDISGMCSNDVDISDCADPDLRFSPGLQCEDLDPPCGVIVGACCFDDDTCSIEEEADCDTAGGTWQGGTSICSQCPCLVLCPEGGIIEGEPVCTDNYVDEFNGGCDAETVSFSPISNCDTVCGESGAFNVGADFGLDFDWYELELVQATTLTWTVEAEYPVLGAIVDGNAGCAGAVLLALDLDYECHVVTVSANVGPGTYWVVAGAANPSDLAQCGSPYTATVSTPICTCSGDIDGDGDVDVNDLLSLLAAWGPNPGNPADLDGDGDVDVSDLLTLLANWGDCSS